MTEQNDVFDLIIVGGGPIGLACAIEAKKAGLSYLILEKGCLVNSLYHYPKNMTFFSTSEKLEIGQIPFMSTLPKPRRNEALEYYRRVQMHFDLHIKYFEKVKSITKDRHIFEITTIKGTYYAKNTIIATGFFDIPKQMGVPGEQLPKVSHYYDEAHFYTGQHVVVVGASNSAIDAALETYRKGAQVSLVVRDNKISDRVKYWVKPDIENRLEEGAIDAYFSSSIAKITPDTVIINTPSGLKTIKNDFVLAMTGYQPDFAFLQQAGIDLLPAPLRIPTYNPDTMETDVPGLYLAGVVCGGMNTHLWFIENSRIHAEIILGHLVGRLR